MNHNSRCTYSNHRLGTDSYGRSQPLFVQGVACDFRCAAVICRCFDGATLASVVIFFFFFSTLIVKKKFWKCFFRLSDLTVVLSKHKRLKSFIVYFEGAMCVFQSNLTQPAHRWFQAEYSPLNSQLALLFKTAMKRGEDLVAVGAHREVYCRPAGTTVGFGTFSAAMTCWCPFTSCASISSSVWMQWLYRDCCTIAVVIKHQLISLKWLPPRLNKRLIVNDCVSTEVSYCHLPMSNKNCS